MHNRLRFSLQLTCPEVEHSEFFGSPLGTPDWLVSGSKGEGAVPPVVMRSGLQFAGQKKSIPPKPSSYPIFLLRFWWFLITRALYRSGRRWGRVMLYRKFPGK